MIKISFTFEKNSVMCKLCSKNTNDICMHFLVDCPCLFMHRDKMLDSIVNCLEASQYVSFSNLSAQEQCNFILGNRSLIDMDELCWEYLMMYIADCINVILIVTQSCLQVSD